MKISIKLEYKDKEYISNYQEFTEDEANVLESLIETVAKGNSNYFSMEINNQKVYFGAEILKESVLTITRKP